VKPSHSTGMILRFGRLAAGKHPAQGAARLGDGASHGESSARFSFWAADATG
jgi:hypothetical protein